MKEPLFATSINRIYVESTRSIIVQSCNEIIRIIDLEVSLKLRQPLLLEKYKISMNPKGLFSFSLSNSAQIYFISMGDNPFIAKWRGTKEKARIESLSDAASQAANKLKSSLFSIASGWLGKDESDATVPFENAALVDALYDDRVIENYSVSGFYAACSDNLGRIMLIDLRLMLVLRIWKGFRNAQFAFSPDAQYLLVKKKNQISVWRLVHGSKFCTVDLDEPCELLRDGVFLFGDGRLCTWSIVITKEYIFFVIKDAFYRKV